MQATNWRPRFEVTCDGDGVVGHAGAALLAELADRLELTRRLAGVPADSSPAGAAIGPRQSCGTWR